MISCTGGSVCGMEIFMKLDWYIHLFTSEKLIKKKRKLIHQFNTDKVSQNVYLLVLRSDGRGRLEAFSAKLLAQPYYRDFDYLVVGLAEDYEDAKEVLRMIVEDFYHRPSNRKLEEFLLQTQELYESGVR